MSAYAARRAQIRSGDLLAWRGRSPGAWIVRHWTGSEISHTGVAMWIAGRLFAIEARPGLGVTMRLLSAALPCEWAGLRIDSADWKRAEEFALRALGRNYSWLDAILAGLGLPPRQWNGYQCAEFVRDVLRRAGMKMDMDGIPMTPRHVCRTAEIEASAGWEYLEGEDHA